MVPPKITILVIAALTAGGCISVSKSTVPQEPAKQIVPARDAAEVQPSSENQELQNIKDEELDQYVETKGVIFAKTDFSGLLKARFVKLLFEDQDDPSHKFQLHISDNKDEKAFPWNFKTVKPGYFFVELPVGKYKISSITIPVGSSTATEEMDVRMEVLPNTICYVGTLRMVGTKERVKLGGVPVIQPGFEYTVEVLDQQEEGEAAFTRNYPNYPKGISVKLMRVNNLPPGSS